VSAPPGKVTPVATLFVAASRQPPVHDQAAPWSLTASDGSGLMLTRVDAKAVVEGPLAFTELHLYFHNPEPRIREGTFAITLPAGAAVSRFAMENHGQFLEAEVVEQQLARRAYEDFLHRKQDPALLEKAEGNQFAARVFPIPAGGDKHLVISFSQEVAPGHYTLPLRGLARAERVEVQVQVRGRDGGIVEQTLRERNWVPDRDVVVDATAIGAPQAIAAGALVAARVRLELADAAQRPAAVTLLVDTSASRGLGFAAQAHAIHQLVDELARAYGGALPVQVVAFDQVTTPIYDGRADALGDLEAALVARGALGASDLGQAMTWLAAHAPHARLVVVTDGVVTAGAQADALPALAKQLAGHGVDRIDVALTGGIRDEQAAAAMARAGLAHAGAVLDLDRGIAEVARRIGLAVRTELPVVVDGARWVFPRTIAAAQAGDEVTVFARRAAASPQLALTVAGRSSVMTPVAVTPALLARAVAGAEITELDGQLGARTGAAAAALRAEIVQRSVAARVISSQTSMLVLESDADYARFGIDRRALADILAVGPTGVELTHRAPPVTLQIAAPEVRTADAKPAKQAFKDDRAELAKPKQAKEEEKAGDTIGNAAQLADKVSERNAPAPAPSVSAPGAPPPPPAAEPAQDVSVQGVAGGYGVRGSASSSGAAVTAAPMRSRVMANGAADSRRLHANREADDDGLGGNRRKPALRGPLAEIERAIVAGRGDVALAKARAWHAKAPGDVLALIGLGDALEATRDVATAARVYGSIIDL
jgi:hypothetical protein